MKNLLFACILCFIDLPDLIAFDGTNENRLLPPSGTVEQIRFQLQESRKAILQIPGGMQFKFRVECESRKESPYFFFPEGLDASVCLRWPELKCDFEGKLHGVILYDKAGGSRKVAMPTEFSSSFNFETMTSVTLKNNASAEIIGRRHEENSGVVFPFAAQYYAEFSDLWTTTDQDFESEYWLPNAIKSTNYKLVGEFELDGVACQLIERAGIDRIWIAPKFGYAVVRRELNWGANLGSKENMTATNFVEVSGAWMPQSITLEKFDRDVTEKVLVRLLITMTEFSVGNVADVALRVAIPKDVQTVKDYVTGTISTAGIPNLDAEQRLLTAVQMAKPRTKSLDLNSRDWISICMALVALVLPLAFFRLRQLRR